MGFGIATHDWERGRWHRRTLQRAELSDCGGVAHKSPRRISPAPSRQCRVRARDADLVGADPDVREAQNDRLFWSISFLTKVTKHTVLYASCKLHGRPARGVVHSIYYNTAPMPTKAQRAKEYSYYTYGFIYYRAVRLQNTLPWSPTSHLKTLYMRCQTHGQTIRIVCANCARGYTVMNVLLIWIACRRVNVVHLPPRV